MTCESTALVVWFFILPKALRWCHLTDRFSKHSERPETIDGVLVTDRATDRVDHCRGHLAQYGVDIPTLNHRAGTVENVGELP